MSGRERGGGIEVALAAVVEHLIDFFDRYVRGPTEALIYDDGFRRWSYSGDHLRATAEAFGGRLADAGLRTGDRLLIWSDSRPEWVAAFWGCTLCGVAVIPLDAPASPELVRRIIKVAEPRGILIGDGLQVEQLPSSMFVWRLRDIRWIDSSTTPPSQTGVEACSKSGRACVDPNTVAEIVFTSGTTGDPKGVVITHRNIVANITPVEREVTAFRRYLWPFRPIQKDVVATSEGLKVFPEDVERVLEGVPGVREAAIVGRVANHAEYVHAVLVLQPNADPTTIIREANAKLESHQRIRDFSVWTRGAFPRTEPMRKLKRFEIRRWVEEGGPERGEQALAPTGDVERLLAKYVKDRVVKPDTTLDELGLTSLDRIELMIALEEQTRVTLSETAVSEARTVGDLRRLTEQAAETCVTPKPFSFPTWNRWRVIRLVRSVSQSTWILPLASLFYRLRVEGREHLRALMGPVIFASNHQSHFDTPVILKALPGRWRRAVAVAMAKEFFDPHFFPEHHTFRERLTTNALYYLVTLFFNAFPLPQKEPGARQTLRYMGELVTNGFSILMFPEGHRTEHGEIQPFQSGVGILGSKLRLPVVPVRLEGVERVLHHTWRWPRRGNVRVTFGAALVLEGDDYAALSRRVQEAVVALQPLAVDKSFRAPDAAA